MKGAGLFCLLLALMLAFAGCASTGSSPTGTSTHIGGYIDTSIQQKF